MLVKTLDHKMRLASWECLGIHEYYPTRPSELEKIHRPGACAKRKSEQEQGRQWQMVYQKQRNVTTLNVRHRGSYFPLSGDVFDYCKTCKPYSRGLVCENQSG